MRRDRFATWLTVMVGNLGIIALAVEPLSTINSLEVIIILMAAGVMGGITAEELRGNNRAHPPLAYLLSGLLAIYVAMAFSFTNTWPDETSTAAVTLLLLGYGAGGIAMYIAAGPDHD